MRHWGKVALTLVSLLGCVQSHPLPEDAGPPDVDAGPEDAGTVAACLVPTEGFGTTRGRRFLPFTLETCDGEPYEFYGEDEGYCETSFTVLSVCAGWCTPCREEAALMRTQIIDRYAGYGVRLISTLVSDNSYSAPSPDFCEDWQAAYDLETVLLDPAQQTQVYFPDATFPANLIIDSEGRIVHREYGISTELSSLRAALDSLLGL
ncbi:MAG: peroxiredoxin family protein [Sandaracinaceae bacterium]